MPSVTPVTRPDAFRRKEYVKYILVRYFPEVNETNEMKMKRISIKFNDICHFIDLYNKYTDIPRNLFKFVTSATM